jgi:hypothetical protein
MSAWRIWPVEDRNDPRGLVLIEPHAVRSPTVIADFHRDLCRLVALWRNDPGFYSLRGELDKYRTQTAFVTQ